ncbi:YciI family protein [Nocardiopsis sediminis]|uniref:YciI family protein n=1 Tax=Nocardiopsis sediminis TaxID=1778267 RepID=A0ABV8FIE7_9ACTN
MTAARTARRGAAEGEAMLWAVHCLDAPDSAEPRERARAAHSARLRAPGDVTPLVYGRLMADDGTTAVGSLLVVAAEDRARVEAYVAEDPFMAEGVWAQVRIHAFSASANAPVPLALD